MSSEIRREMVPVSFILPTRNRAPVLRRFFERAREQEVMPAEIVVCDGSDDEASAAVVGEVRRHWDVRTQWCWQRALQAGLAPQRNQAVAAATQPYVMFLDDDILLEPGCLKRLYEVVSGDEATGGATATLTNEPYHPPGRATRWLMRWFEDGHERSSYASACVGPGWTFLHDPAGPERTKAEWMGGGCTLYRKAALPAPAVPAHFEEGAIGEDLAVSLQVAKNWRTWHVRDARAVHDSQGGEHKRSRARQAELGWRNRHWIMRRVMGRTALRDEFDFVVMHLFILGSLMRSWRTAVQAPACVLGWVRGAMRVVFSGEPAPRISQHG